MFSGVYYEVEVLPLWMQKVAWFSPATYALKGMREAILDGKPFSSLNQYTLPLLLMGIVMLPVGIMTFKKMEQHAKKKGLLKRNG